MTFVKLERIGRGSYGKVFKCQDKRSGELVAAKVINLEEEQLTDDVLEDLRSEVHLLSQCSSPYIVRYKGFHCMLDSGLRRVLETLGPLGEERVLVIAKQILEGLGYLHAQGIVHRDVKAANLLLDMHGRIKLGDFGVAQNVSKTFKMVGTPYWMAPEVIRANACYDRTKLFDLSFIEKADIWSLGITLYELFKGNPPLIHLPPTKALIVIPQSMPPRLDRTDRGLSDLVNLCLHDDPLQRPTAAQLLKLKCLRALDAKTVSKVMNEVWREYQERLARIEPDAQSLLSKESNGEVWGEEWRFEGEVESEPLPLSSSSESSRCEDDFADAPVATVAVEPEIPKSILSSSASHLSRNSHNSHNSHNSQISQLSQLSQKSSRLQHRKTPSLLSLQLNEDEREECNNLPGIYHDLGGIIDKGRESERKERRELAIMLKTGRRAVVLEAKVTTGVVQSQIDYLKERIDRVTRALYLLQTTTNQLTTNSQI